MADLTPELLAQLEKDAAWFSPDESPYRLGIEGELTIDGEEEDADEMTIYGEMDDGATSEVATFHVDGMAPRVVRLFAVVPALVAAAKERDQLRASLADKEEEIGQLSEMLGPSQIDRANLRDQVDQLQAEVERLRGLGLDATEILHAAIDGEPWAEQFEIKRGLLRAQIERKP